MTDRPVQKERLGAISAGFRTKSRPDVVLAGVAVAVLLVGMALRIWIVNGTLGTLNADETLSGTMARALLHGNPSTFYWGQHYGGTIELFPFAALIAALPDSLAIVVLPILESAVIAVLLYVIARRRLGGTAAAATVALASVLSASSVWFSTRAMLFYQPSMIAGLGAIIAAEQITEDQPSGRGRTVRWAILGLLIGVGWWTSTQIVFFAAPAIGWIAWKRAVSGWRNPLVGLVAAVVGAAPWLADNLRTRGSSLRDLPGGTGGYVDHLVAQWERGWPMAFGLRRPFDERWILAGHGWLLAAIAVAVSAGVVCAFVIAPRIRSPLVGVVLVFPLVHALAPSSDYVGTGRYYVYLVPSIAYAVVAALTCVRWSRAWIGATLVLVAMSTTATLYGIRDVRPGLESTDALAAALHERGIERVYSNYWTSYRLVWDDESFIASPDIFDRRPDWSAAVRAAGDDDVAYVFDLTADGRADDLTARLAEFVGIDEQFDVGTFRVVIPSRNVPPELLPAATGDG